MKGYSDTYYVEEDYFSCPETTITEPEERQTSSYERMNFDEMPYKKSTVTKEVFILIEKSCFCKEIE